MVAHLVGARVQRRPDRSEWVALDDHARRVDLAEETGSGQLIHCLGRHPVLSSYGLEDLVVTWDSRLLDAGHDASGSLGDSDERHVGPEPHRRSSPVVLQVPDGPASVDHDVRDRTAVTSTAPDAAPMAAIVDVVIRCTAAPST